MSHATGSDPVQADDPVAAPLATDGVTDAVDTTEPEATSAKWAVGEWLGKPIVDCDGERIGKLRDVYVDVETDAPMFGTVREGVFARHLTFVPLVGVQVSPDSLQVTATRERVRSAPDIERQGEELAQSDESALYHHFEQNYTPITSESGRRLARR